MEIEFKPINKNNYKECVKLRVFKEQENFVSTNYWSLLEVNYEDGERTPMGIYNNEKMIGFFMFSFYKADKDYPVDSWWYERFMIDSAYQRKGFGRASLYKSLDYARKNLGKIEFRIAAEPENDVAIKLYEEAGFKKTGEMVCGEVVLLMNL